MQLILREANFPNLKAPAFTKCLYLIEKWTKEMNRRFTEKKIYTTLQYIKMFNLTIRVR